MLHASCFPPFFLSFAFFFLLPSSFLFSLLSPSPCLLFVFPPFFSFLPCFLSLFLFLSFSFFPFLSFPLFLCPYSFLSSLFFLFLFFPLFCFLFVSFLLLSSFFLLSFLSLPFRVFLPSFALLLSPLFVILPLLLFFLSSSSLLPLFFLSSSFRPFFLSLSLSGGLRCMDRLRDGRLAKQSGVPVGGVMAEDGHFPISREVNIDPPDAARRPTSAINFPAKSAALQRNRRISRPSILPEAAARSPTTLWGYGRQKYGRRHAFRR